MTKVKLSLLAAAATLPLAGSALAGHARVTHICTRRTLRLLLLAWAAGSAGILGSTQTLAQNAYITNNQSNNVSVINTRTNEVTATVSVGGGPWGVAVSPDGRKVYTANWYYDVSVIDTATNAVTSIPNIWNGIGGNAIGIAVSRDGRRVYASNFYQQNVSVIDTATNTVIAAAPTGPGPFGVVVANEKVYIASWASPFTVTVVDTVTNKVIATIPIASESTAPELAASPDGRRVYVTNEIGDNVPVIDTGTDTVIATIPVSISQSATVSSDGTKVYISAGNHLHGFDVVTNQFVMGSDYIGGPGGVSVTQDNSRVYAVNFGWNAVMVVDAVTGAVAAPIPVGSGPLAYGNFIQPKPTFAGTPGKANCYGKSVSALAQQYGGLNNAAAALGYPSVSALQNAIEAYCEA